MVLLENLKFMENNLQPQNITSLFGWVFNNKKETRGDARIIIAILMTG